MPVNWYGKQVKGKVVGHVENVLNWGRLNIEAETKRLIGKRGITKTAGSGKGTHSKPGEPPFRQKGRLINSIASELIKRGKLLAARIGSTIKPEGGQKHSYAYMLEFLMNRKYLRPALNKWWPAIKRKLRMR